MNYSFTQISTDYLLVISKFKDYVQRNYDFEVKSEAKTEDAKTTTTKKRKEKSTYEIRKKNCPLSKYQRCSINFYFTFFQNNPCFII